jgi:hypothetical protein
MGCDIHLFIERKHAGGWVPVNAPEHEGEVDYSQPYPWGAWTDPPNTMEQLAQELLPLSERVPARAFEWAFGRNYDAFGRLSGVRRDEVCYREPNGYPEDLSPQVRERLWDDDGHTPTHWTLEDLDEAHEHREKDDDQGYGIERISDLLQQMWRIAKEFNLPPSDVRMVCFYDN